MRHRGDATAAGKTVMSSRTGTLSKLTDLLSEEPAPGRHRVATPPLIPTQKVPVHEGSGTTEVTETVSVADVLATAPQEDVANAPDETEELAPQVAPVQPHPSLPARAQWRASHGPRLFAATMLLLAVAGTAALGVRYAETRGTQEFVAVIIGVGVVVALWALLIASTPQVVSLRGSVLTVRNSSGSERFDLADGLQPVDVVGEPRTSQWALLLHRPNNTSVVLRRRDVDAAVLDPIVRHYRALAEQRYADRQVRFSR